MFKILIAEDDNNLRNIVETTLKKENYTVFAAENGKAALDLYYSEKVDLVITDVMMPVMDGNELCAELRKAAPDLPILMLTALEALDDKEKGFNSGADDYLTKTFALKELLLRIKALLRRYSAAYEHKIVLPHTELDYGTLSVAIDGEAIELTNRVSVAL